MSTDQPRLPPPRVERYRDGYRSGAVIIFGPQRIHLRGPALQQVATKLNRIAAEEADRRIQHTTSTPKKDPR